MTALAEKHNKRIRNLHRIQPHYCWQSLAVVQTIEKTDQSLSPYAQALAPKYMHRRPHAHAHIQLSTLYSQLSILNSQPSTLNSQLSTRLTLLHTTLQARKNPKARDDGKSRGLPQKYHSQKHKGARRLQKSRSAPEMPSRAWAGLASPTSDCSKGTRPRGRSRWLRLPQLRPRTSPNQEDPAQFRPRRPQ